MIGFKAKLKFIVAGVARSGTVYMSRVLTSLGIPCGHESIFNEDVKEMVMKRLCGLVPPKFSEVSLTEGWTLDDVVADSSYMSIPYLNTQKAKDIPIIHVVRNPLAVISSLVKDFHYFCGVENNPFNQNGYEEWIYEHIPEMTTISDPVERACLYWVRWNQRIEEASINRSHYFQRAEDEFDRNFFDFLGVVRKVDIYGNRKANSRKSRTADFTTMDIPEGKTKDEFIFLMRKYKYG